jgi:hypothetical protein
LAQLNEQLIQGTVVGGVTTYVGYVIQALFEVGESAEVLEKGLQSAIQAIRKQPPDNDTMESLVELYDQLTQGTVGS